MEILRIAKNNKPIGQRSASLLISSIQIQFLTLIFFSGKKIPMYNSIFDWPLIKSESATELIIIFNFVANLMILGFLIIKTILCLGKKQNRNQTTYQSNFFLFLQIKPYLMFVFLMNINIQNLRNDKSWLTCFIIFNILFAVGELFLFQQVNASFRFVENNFIRKKNNSILPWILIIITIFSFHYLGEIYTAIIALVRAIISAYFNFTSLENQKIRKLSWFYSLLTFQFIVVSFIHAYIWDNFFNNTVNFTFFLLFAVYCTDSVTENLVLNTLKFHLKRYHNYLSDQKSQEQSSSLKVLISPQESKQLLVAVRILVKIYFSRKTFLLLHENHKQHSNDFDNWWKFFNKFILDHKYYCQNTLCTCHQLKPRSLLNPKMQDKLLQNKISSLIDNLKANWQVKNHQVKIIQNYYMIQIEKKPLKTYYSLIKLAGRLTITQEILQVQNLISETRVSFSQLFLKEKVQNNNLNIHQLLQFHDKMKQFKGKMGLLSLQYKNFYQLFTKNFVQTGILKEKTEILNQAKAQFNREIDFYLSKLQKNAELLSFSFIYYKYFDEYNQKFDNVIKNIQNLNQASKYTNYKNKRYAIDIFNPQYGAIKADLISRPGKIVSITTNICDMLGYKHQQLIGHKINKCIPSLFSKNHDRYLRNFIQNGSLKILKCKQKKFLAKTSSKFITPISLRLKVDYLSSQNFFISSLIRRTPTKSQFILMNNNGKIEQISEKFYNLLFRPSLREEVGKIKRLCAYKMLLSLNFLQKTVSPNDDRVYDGIILTSENQDALNQYFNFPQFGIIHNNNQNNNQQSTSNISKNTKTLSTLGTESSNLKQSEVELETSQTDLKQSFRQYFRAINFNNTRGFLISFKFYQFSTNQFNCKLLEVLHIHSQLTIPNLKKQLSKQFIQLGQYLEFQKQELKKFEDIKKEIQTLQSINFKSLNSQQKDPILRADEILQNSNFQQHLSEMQITRNLLQAAVSEASSVILGNQNQKRKLLVIDAFKRQQFISKKFEIILIFFILLMTALLVIFAHFLSH